MRASQKDILSNYTSRILLSPRPLVSQPIKKFLDLSNTPSCKSPSSKNGVRTESVLSRTNNSRRKIELPNLAQEIQLRRRLKQTNHSRKNVSKSYCINKQGDSPDDEKIKRRSCQGDLFGYPSTKEKALNTLYPHFMIDANRRNQRQSMDKRNAIIKMKDIFLRNVETLKAMTYWHKRQSQIEQEPIAIVEEEEEPSPPLNHHKSLLVSTQINKFRKHPALEGQSRQQFLWRVRSMNESQKSNKRIGTVTIVPIEQSLSESDSSSVTSVVQLEPQEQIVKSILKARQKISYKSDTIKIVGIKPSRTVSEYVKKKSPESSRSLKQRNFNNQEQSRSHRFITQPDAIKLDLHQTNRQQSGNFLKNSKSSYLVLAYSPKSMPSPRQHAQTEADPKKIPYLPSVNFSKLNLSKSKFSNPQLSSRVVRSNAIQGLFKQ